MPVKTWSLIACDTAFYAIIIVTKSCWRNKDLLNLHCFMLISEKKKKQSDHPGSCLKFLLSVGSAVFQQILKELYSTEDSAEDSVFCETKCEPLESRPQRSILKVTRLCKAVKKGK